jgi:hypothetical protein
MGTQFSSWTCGCHQKHTLKEIVKIRIGIVPVFENSPSKYKILVDDKLFVENNDSLISGATQYHDLAVSLDKGPHYLDIRIDPTGLQFENIEVVEIAFNNQKLRDIDCFLMGEYLLDQPRLIDGVLKNKIDQCTVLGFPGTYRVDFSTPIMVWMIRNL